MPFAWATVNIMEVISTAAIERDVTDSESIKGGLFWHILMHLSLLTEVREMVQKQGSTIISCICVSLGITDPLVLTVSFPTSSASSNFLSVGFLVISSSDFGFLCNP